MTRVVRYPLNPQAIDLLTQLLLNVGHPSSPVVALHVDHDGITVTTDDAALTRNPSGNDGDQDDEG